MTSNTIASGRINGLKALSRGEPTGDGGALPGGDPTSSVDVRVMNAGELTTGIATEDIDSRQDWAQEPPTPNALHS